MEKLPPLIQELPYHPDSGPLFARWADDPWAMFLDSGTEPGRQGRYDIIAIKPWKTLVTCGEMTRVEYDGRVDTSSEDPFLLLQQCLETAPHVVDDDFPFSGGALGYFAYDLGRRIESIGQHAEDAEQIPEMMLGIYDWAFVADHQLQRSWLVGQGRRAETHEQWAKLTELFSTPSQHALATEPFRLRSRVRSNMDRDGYMKAFSSIKKYLREGDCYQVNLAQRFSADAVGHGWHAYEVLRKINSAPFSSYMNLPGVEILSSSPERFLKVRHGNVETKPIKGTLPRFEDPEMDRKSADRLQHSRKDRAENLMIVDLLRNDLGKSCRTGTVKVPLLFDIESFATVHHLVSTIVGELDDNIHPVELLKGSFPGGSITGAPKIRAMQIIEELEPNRRGIYCGALGYIGFNGSMDTNIAIRTMVYSRGTIRFWAGGGIVSDSVGEDEYQETYHKAAALMELLDSARFTQLK